MLELILCSMLTILPDYLFRRFGQGKRFGREITLFTVWYELRYGLTGCMILTISLITVVFYYHPSTTNVSSFFRTVSVLPERVGRVKEVQVQNNMTIEVGDVIFTLEDDEQIADRDTAIARVDETKAHFKLVEDELAAAQGTIDQALGNLEQAHEELAVQQQLLQQGSAAVAKREVERLENLVQSNAGALATAEANYKAIETKKTVLLPAQLVTAEAELYEAERALAQSTVYASISGEVQQFALQPGDLVTPLMRPAGILVPPDVNQDRFLAGFDQVSTQVLKTGMVAELTCRSNPFVIIPMVIVEVQDFLPSGQFQPSDQLQDIQDRARPGTVMVTMVPVAEGSVDAIPRGSKCVANAYTYNHERLANEDLPLGEFLFLHLVDTVGLVHALILRIQVLLMPVQTLVLSGH
ncbi:hypothetical protein CLV78_11926 [Aliiruegeria haliotis]|uniref:Multidrug resistance efflux pump n=1 Tax=Aliiruegeria haliotis TaxID=1280846 RepID=A0A2T0RES6_9RHOB|nr:HlyD family secretion protein [Aliiruegeria haliotis]PRY19694.1 hypothetical protein CLV78_11926 [Aliiruegeria haliotis]